jgi:hypothetical protein
MTPFGAGLDDGDVEGDALGEDEGDALGEDEGDALGEDEGDALGEDGIGASGDILGADSPEGACPPPEKAFTPSAIAIKAKVPPPTTVRLVVLIEFETVPLPDSCLRFSRRSRFASLRACCDIGHQTLTDG